MAAHQVLTCPICNYSTNRRYNLIRHTMAMHGLPMFSITENVNPITENVNLVTLSKNVTAVKCPSCYKVFARKYNLQQHSLVCKHISHPNQCDKCHRIFSAPSSLSRHHKKCTGIVPDMTTVTPASAAPTVTNNITHVAGDQINNNTQNNILVLSFPHEEYADFDFICDHIDSAQFRKIWNQGKPELGLQQFVHALMNKKENRCVKKSGPNVAYSTVHRGDGEWEFIRDRDIIPQLAYQISVAALTSYNEHKGVAQVSPEKLRKMYCYLDKINTEIDPEIGEFIERLKYCLVNITRRYESEVLPIQQIRSPLS